MLLTEPNEEVRRVQFLKSLYLFLRTLTEVQLQDLFQSSMLGCDNQTWTLRVVKSMADSVSQDEFLQVTAREGGSAFQHTLKNELKTLFQNKEAVQLLARYLSKGGVF